MPANVYWVALVVAVNLPDIVFFRCDSLRYSRNPRGVTKSELARESGIHLRILRINLNGSVCTCGALPERSTSTLSIRHTLQHLDSTQAFHQHSTVTLSFHHHPSIPPAFQNSTGSHHRPEDSTSTSGSHRHPNIALAFHRHPSVPPAHRAFHHHFSIPPAA